jgi:tetratricopeptide (TPR) repeat protein
MRSGDVDAALELLEPLVRADQIDARLVRSLTSVADPLEAESERLRHRGQGSEQRNVDAMLEQLYRLLLECAKRSKDTASQTQEASLRRRLARVAQRLGRHARALPHYVWLLKNIKRETSGDVMRGLAIAYEHVRQYDQAIPLWQELCAGLDRGTDGWFEARLHLIRACQRAGMPTRAKRLLDYLNLDFPGEKAGRWRKEFDELGE